MSPPRRNPTAFELWQSSLSPLPYCLWRPPPGFRWPSQEAAVAPQECG